MTQAHPPTHVHATFVVIDKAYGVLIIGPSGTGKSDLALRLIDEGAELVADDQVAIELHGHIAIGRAPARLFGLLEVRGLGIMRVTAKSAASISHAVQLVPQDEIERLPERATYALPGFPSVAPLPLLRLYPFEASAPAKLRAFVRLHRAE